MNLSPTTILRRADGLSFTLDSYHEALVTLPGGSFTTGYHTLAVFHAFSTPRSIASVLAALGPRLVGQQDWVELTSTIARLYQSGVLVGEGPAPEVAGDTAYEHALSAIAILNNPSLVEPFLAAITAAVRPGAVVVELAASTGLLAVAAARAGAGRVYVRAVAGATELVRAGLITNNVADTVQLLDEGVPLPPSDLLISEAFLAIPRGREPLRTLHATAATILKPGGQTVPIGWRRLVLPVAIPPAVVARQTFTSATVDNWRDWYSIDFTPCAEVAARTPRLCYPERQEAATWPTLGEASVLIEARVGSELPAIMERTTTITATAAGEVSGLLLVNELLLGDDRILSTHPLEAPSLAQHVGAWLLPQPIPVTKGARLQVAYREPAATAAFRIIVACAEDAAR